MGALARIGTVLLLLMPGLALAESETELIPNDLPAAECILGGALPAIEDPWLEFKRDPVADPSISGFIELLRFRVMPSASEGRALVVRLAGTDAHPPLFRGERRAWVLVLNLGRVGAYAMEYAYTDPGKVDDLWVYRSQYRRVVRLSRTPLPDASPILRLCRALGAAGLATEVEILERSSGWVEPGAELRRAISLNKGGCW